MIFTVAFFIDGETSNTSPGLKRKRENEECDGQFFSIISPIHLI